MPQEKSTKKSFVETELASVNLENAKSSQNAEGLDHYNVFFLRVYELDAYLQQKSPNNFHAIGQSARRVYLGQSKKCQKLTECRGSRSL